VWKRIVTRNPFAEAARSDPAHLVAIALPAGIGRSRRLAAATASTAEERSP
jgi:hypothetical protein